MRELSLIILDIAENSVSAGARNVYIELFEHGAMAELKISDDGCGMTEEVRLLAEKGEYTSKQGTGFGQGIKQLKSEARSVLINSKEGAGTSVRAFFKKRDIIFSEKSLAQTLADLIFCHKHTEFVFRHYSALLRVEIDSRRLKRILCDTFSGDGEIFSLLSRELNLQYGEQK